MRSHASLGEWLDAYFRAWETNDPRDLEVLFAEDAVYHYGPFREPARGRAAIVESWIGGPPRPGLRWAHDVLAVSGSIGVAHFSASWRIDGNRLAEMDGVLLLRFDQGDRCVEHREWYAQREVPQGVDLPAPRACLEGEPPGLV